MKSEKQAQNCFKRLGELEQEASETQANLSKIEEEKGQLLRSQALNPNGATKSKVEDVNKKLFGLQTELGDVQAQQEIVRSELYSTAAAIKNQRLLEIQKRAARLKAEKEKVNDQIRELHAKIQQLRSVISVNRVHIEGEIIEVDPEKNVAYQSLLLESELEEIKNLTPEGILAELEITVG